MAQKKIEENKKQIKQQIQNWNPGCENITLSTILSKIRMHNNKQHVINHGDPGSGKSRSTLELIQILDPEKTIFLDNTTTDRGLFETFLEYPDSDIILDECSTLLRSLRTQDMIKLCMEGKSLNWTKKDKTETTEPYKGTIIINTNQPINNSVSDRCIYNETANNREKVLEFIDVYTNKEKENHEEFIKYCKQRLNDKKEYPLTNQETKKIIEFTKQKIMEADPSESFSRRIIIRQLNYFERAKKFFVELDEETMTYLFKITEPYITNNKTPSLLDHLLSNGGIEKPNLVKKLAEEGKYSEQHARRLINEAIQNNKLKLNGKIVSKTQTI